MRTKSHNWEREESSIVHLFFKKKSFQWVVLLYKVVSKAFLSSEVLHC